MVCRLCQQDRRLCNSHIIPEFIYNQAMYDEKHRFFVVPGNPGKPVQYRQKGIHERLLCQECETRLSRHENYVRRMLYGELAFAASSKEDHYSLSGLEYQHVRLFYLSILWRMGVSSLPMFAAVSLGTHADRLRAMILSDDPGRPESYGFIAVAPFIDGKFYPDFILEPECMTRGGHHIYRAVIGGLLLLFLVSSHPVDPEVQRAFVQPDGTWMIMAKDIRRIPFLAEWLGQAARRQ